MFARHSASRLFASPALTPTAVEEFKRAVGVHAGLCYRKELAEPIATALINAVFGEGKGEGAVTYAELERRIRHVPVSIRHGDALKELFAAQEAVIHARYPGEYNKDAREHTMYHTQQFLLGREAKLQFRKILINAWDDMMETEKQPAPETRVNEPIFNGQTCKWVAQRLFPHPALYDVKPTYQALEEFADVFRQKLGKMNRSLTDKARDELVDVASSCLFEDARLAEGACAAYDIKFPMKSYIIRARNLPETLRNNQYNDKSLIEALSGQRMYEDVRSAAEEAIAAMCKEMDLPISTPGQPMTQFGR